jgi:hypothetical protein
MEKGTVFGEETGTVLKEDDSRKPLYQEIVGSLLYLPVHTRPDLSHDLGVLT